MKNITENDILIRGTLHFNDKQINSKTEIQVRQKVNWPFGSDSEGVETHKKNSRCRKIRSFDLGLFRSLRSRFAI